MYVVIDREYLCVKYKHPNQSAINNLACIEIPYQPIVVVSATDKDSFESFTDYELKVMYENLCGLLYSGFRRPDLVTSVIRLIGMLSETDLVPREVDQQLDTIKDPDDGPFQYVRGSAVPKKQNELWLPPTMVTRDGVIPNGKKYHVPDPVKRVQPLYSPVYTNPALFAAPSTPAARANSTGEPSAPAAPPKAGSTTGRVWAIADDCYQKHSVLDKTLRKMVADECEAQGINSSTMSVQFSKWKGHKLAQS